MQQDSKLLLLLFRCFKELFYISQPEQRIYTQHLHYIEVLIIRHQIMKNRLEH